MVLSVFAAIGLVLVIVGVFSVMAYSVSLQTHEIGIRMALGAQPSSVLGMVLARGLRLIAVGIILGELASLVLTRFIASQIWGVSARDPLTLGAIAAVIASRRFRRLCASGAAGLARRSLGCTPRRVRRGTRWATRNQRRLLGRLPRLTTRSARASFVGRRTWDSACRVGFPSGID